MLWSFKPAILLNRTGITDSNGLSEASNERVLADLYHINSKYYVDNPIAIDNDLINEIKGKVAYNAHTC